MCFSYAKPKNLQTFFNSLKKTYILRNTVIVSAHFKNVDHVTVDVVLSYQGSQRLVERRGMTSRHHGSTISGWQNQRRRRRKENGKKVKGFYWTNDNFARASRYFVHFFAVVAPRGKETS